MFLILSLPNWINKTSSWRTLRFSRKLTNWHSLEVSGIRPCWTCTCCVNRHFLTGRALPDSCSGESSLFWWIIIKPPCCLRCLFFFFFSSFPSTSEKGSYPGTSTWEQTLLLVCLLQHWPAPSKSAPIWYRQDQGQPSLTLAVSSTHQIQCCHDVAPSDLFCLTHSPGTRILQESFLFFSPGRAHGTSAHMLCNRGCCPAPLASTETKKRCPCQWS